MSDELHSLPANLGSRSGREPTRTPSRAASPASPRWGRHQFDPVATWREHKCPPFAPELSCLLDLEAELGELAQRRVEIGRHQRRMAKHRGGCRLGQDQVDLGSLAVEPQDRVPERFGDGMGSEAERREQDAEAVGLGRIDLEGHVMKHSCIEPAAYPRRYPFCTPAVRDGRMMQGGIRTLKVALTGLILAVALALAVMLTIVGQASAGQLPDGLQSDGRFAGTSIPEQQSRSAEDFWTPERLARAEPLDGDAAADLGAQAPSPLAQPAPTPFESEPVDPLGYPNRVHGKIFFQFPNALPGLYSCSGTVVTSGSGSLINTAAHCVFDFKTKSLASGMVFIPGFSAGSTPYGVWPVTNTILNKKWVTKKDSYDDDFAMVRVAPIFGVIQNLGSRGIGFNQSRHQHVQEYGYPAEGKPTYDGNLLIRCESGLIKELRRYGGPDGIGMRCDSQGGTSGGGWVAQKSFLISNSSHGYPTYNDNQLFGPYFGTKAKQMYKASTPFWPSIGPIKCRGEVASIVGTNFTDDIKGTNGRDVIATVGGDDKIDGRGGEDVICGGSGRDKVKGGGGKDRIDGGSGYNRCGSRKGGTELKACEGGK